MIKSTLDSLSIEVGIPSTVLKSYILENVKGLTSLMNSSNP